MEIVIRLKRTVEYIDWYEKQRPKDQAQIVARLANIELFTHFGSIRRIGQHLSELKWVNGRRIYYAILQDGEELIALLILGGNKNGQDSDIRRAQKILERHI